MKLILIFPCYYFLQYLFKGTNAYNYLPKVHCCLTILSKAVVPLLTLAPISLKTFDDVTFVELPFFQRDVCPTLVATQHISLSKILLT
jgi:hypothetical protein